MQIFCLLIIKFPIGNHWSVLFSINFGFICNFTENYLFVLALALGTATVEIYPRNLIILA